MLPPDRRVYKVRDSKMLTEPEREILFDRIAAWCSTWAVGHAVSSWAQRGEKITAAALKRLQSDAASGGRNVAKVLMQRSGKRILPWKTRDRDDAS